MVLTAPRKEADKTLKEHAEKHQTSSTSTVQLQARTETLEKGYEDVKERLGWMGAGALMDMIDQTASPNRTD